MSASRFMGLAMAAVATAWGTAAAGADVTITDEDFAELDWSVVELRDDTTNDSAEFVGAQQTTGGNPGAYRFVADSWIHDGLGSVTLVAGHLRTSADYQPTSQGEVGTVAFSFDVRTSATTYQTESLLLFVPLIVQDGAYYAADRGAEGTEAWGPFDSGALGEGNFGWYAGDPQAPSNPDFSAVGAPMTFGFAVAVGPHALAGAYSTEGGLDNFTVAVREPSSSPDAGAGGSGGGSTSHGSGTLPGGQPGTAVPRPDDGCGCRLQPRRPGTLRSWEWWSLLAAACLWAGRSRRPSRQAA